MAKLSKNIGGIKNFRFSKSKFDFLSEQKFRRHLWEKFGTSSELRVIKVNHSARHAHRNDVFFVF